MQIYSITPMNKRCSYETAKKQQITNTQQNRSIEQNFSTLPSTKQYLSFLGGYSLNLAETIKNLDKLAEKNSSIYPKNIREWAGMILEGGNKAKDTLVSIHKKYYEALKHCNTLEEVKKRFPEFSEVLSDSEVKFSKSSFGDAVKAGELEYFDKNEDLSLQLLKLYYGEGFSLNDLKKYANGKDIYYTMRKLNIPSQSRDYGHILKFSDPEYNARLTAEMTYKRRLALDEKAKMEGEPIYIPRGPLSKEHREHISEGLKKYYRENPERIYQMSDKMKDFYQQNPEKAKELERVLNKAWNIFGADRIKNAMSQFMKSRGFNSFDPQANPIDISKEQSKVLKQFWGANEWARKSFSKNMEYAWRKVKEENETFFSLKTVPTQLQNFIEKRFGIEKGVLNFETTYNPYIRVSSIDDYSQSIMSKCNDLSGLSDIMADTYQLSIWRIMSSLEKMNLKNKPKSFKTLKECALQIISENLGKGGKTYKTQTTGEAQNDYMALAMYAAESKNPELVELVNKALDEGFEIAVAAKKNFILK